VYLIINVILLRTIVYFAEASFVSIDLSCYLHTCAFGVFVGQSTERERERDEASRRGRLSSGQVDVSSSRRTSLLEQPVSGYPTSLRRFAMSRSRETEHARSRKCSLPYHNLVMIIVPRVLDKILKQTAHTETVHATCISSADDRHVDRDQDADVKNRKIGMKYLSIP